MAQIEILQADITRLDVDAIVNAANRHLTPGGGVCGAIHAAAGPRLAEECAGLGDCETGNAKLTQGYDLPARYVIHAVGPIWRGGNENEVDLLASAYRNSIRLADENELHSIAFPAISCGIYGYPIEAASAIAIDATLAAMRESEHVERAVFACFGQDIEAALRQAAAHHSL